MLLIAAYAFVCFHKQTLESYMLINCSVLASFFLRQVVLGYSLTVIPLISSMILDFF